MRQVSLLYHILLPNVYKQAWTNGLYADIWIIGSEVEAFWSWPYSALLGTGNFKRNKQFVIRFRELNTALMTEGASHLSGLIKHAYSYDSIDM